MHKGFKRSILIAASLAGGLMAQAALAADKVVYQLDWLPGG